MPRSGISRWAAPRAGIQVNEILSALSLTSSWMVSMTGDRSEEHTSELQSLMRTSYAGFCLTKKEEQPTATERSITAHADVSGRQPAQEPEHQPPMTSRH